MQKVNPFKQNTLAKELGINILNDKNVRIYESLIASGKALSPRGMYYYARELKDHGGYAEAIKWFSLFLDSGLGWMEDNTAACGELVKCYLAENQSTDLMLALLSPSSVKVNQASICIMEI